MVSADWATKSVTEQACAVRESRVSSRELVELYLDRAEQLGEGVNALVTIDEEGARRTADELDRMHARGRSAGPLHGVPFSVKDALETQGIRSTCGVPEMAGHVPDADAVAVARVKQAGGVLLGKSNTPMWCGDSDTVNEIFGATHNPWDPSRSAGGSSGGSAAAVAAGLTGFELGTDICGSIRSPSSLCGVFGHKPSYGIVPQHGYLDQIGGCVMEPDLNVVGPIARGAADLALVLDVLAGPGAAAATAWQLALPRPRPLRDCRVALWLDVPDCPLPQAYRTAMTKLAGELSDAGVAVTEAHPDVDFRHQSDLCLTLVAAAMTVSGDDDGGMTHLAWLRAQEEKHRLESVWRQWFASYDLLICPTWPGPAFVPEQDVTVAQRSVCIDGRNVSHLDATRWFGLVSVVGLPSTALPIGDIGGLPIGAQIVGPSLHDHQTIAAAGEISRSRGGYRPPPGF
ncbi:MAG TPA: amidase family protein [Amycolatopsis sp.]|nr:amidase family protein [Amycolatopsis sp.]